jgi:hypothetical protein
MVLHPSPLGLRPERTQCSRSVCTVGKCMHVCEHFSLRKESLRATIYPPLQSGKTDSHRDADHASLISFERPNSSGAKA